MFDGTPLPSRSSAASQIPPSFNPDQDPVIDPSLSDRSEMDQQADKVAALAAQDTAAFAVVLGRRLAEIGARTQRAIVFSLLPDGSIGVVGASPDKIKLEQLFVDDLELFQQFHLVSRQNDMVASAEICRRYLEDSYGAQTDDARLIVWRRYRGLCDQMESMAGRLIFAGGQLLSGALQFTQTALTQ